MEYVATVSFFVLVVLWVLAPSGAEQRSTAQRGPEPELAPSVAD